MVVSPTQLTVKQLQDRLRTKAKGKGITQFDRKGLVALWYRTHPKKGKSPRRKSKSPARRKSPSRKICRKYSPRHCKLGAMKRRTSRSPKRCTSYTKRHCTSPRRKSRSPRKVRKSPKKSKK